MVRRLMYTLTSRPKAIVNAARIISRATMAVARSHDSLTDADTACPSPLGASTIKVVLVR